MVKALFDSNILVDYLNGIAPAKEELIRYRDRSISVITWMEVMAGAAPEVETATRGFLSGFEWISIDQDIADAAVTIRRDRKIKLPDAIIWATAQSKSLMLVTRNTKDFPADEPWVRMPYSI
jgi:predicted nucleic acid-binding protein